METDDRTLGQKRAKHALQQIKEKVMSKEDKEIQYSFLSYVSSLPATIVMNGLGQAMAFELSKKDVGHRLLYGAISEWLCKSENAIYKGKNDLITAITEGSQEQYIIAQAEALVYLEWLKKFSRAYLKKKEE